MGWKRSLLLFAVLLLPITVSAGLVSSISNLFFRNTSAEENLIDGKSVQSMNLLAASVVPSGEKNSHGPQVQGDALVSESGLGGGAPDGLAKPSSDQISIYVVREGDTISQIAEMFGVTVNTIKWGNDLTGNTLKTGQTLVILPISGVKYTVVKGDTLDSVAKKFKGDIDEIRNYNNLQKGEALAVGTTIIIPDGEVVPAYSPSSSGSKGSTSSGGKTYAGYYMRPASGIKTQGIHGYNAVDIGAPVGTPIYASADGQVIIARSGGWNGGYGSYIVIRHSNGTQTLYAHASKINVSTGDSVSKGDVIGAVGSTGKSTGPHLHFEIRGAKNPF